jgi:4-amino-4-deoxy-L-arabinose transferase-like glycosyltransferase
VTDPAPTDPAPRRRPLFWLILALLWFAPLNSPHLFEPDEGRYAEIPREMVVSGDWITPRLNAIKYFEKPVLQYWSTAVAYQLFGPHAWSARLWPALCGFLGLLLTFWLARALYDERTAMLAVLIQSSALLYLGLARIATVDMSLSFGLQLCLSALALLAQQRDAARGASAVTRPTAVRPWLSPRQLSMLLGIGMAVAVLSKGLVGILIPAAVAGLYMLWRWDWRLPLRARPWWSLLVLIVLAAPWFLAVSARNPEFAHFFFIVQHFQRYLSSASFDRYQPAWFFIPVLLLGFLPWTTLLPGALLQGWRDARTGAHGAALLLVWTVFVFAFFSVSQSKLIPYILPLLPSLALLAARRAAVLSATDFARHFALLALAAGSVGALLLLLWRLPAAAELVESASDFSIAALVAGFLALALAAAVGAWFARRLQPLDAATAGALGAWLLALCLLQAADRLPRMHTLVELEQRAQPWLGNSTRFYCVNDYLQPLPFYWRRPCTLVGYRGELDFGLKQEPWRWIPDLQQFARAWAAEADALAILRPEDYRRLAALGLPMHVIYTSQSLIAVVRR